MENDVAFKKTKANEKVKDSMFRSLFNDEENFRQLYEQITNKELKGKLRKFDTEEIFERPSLINDVSFLSENNKAIIMVEHQSTLNHNMALRCLLYYTKMVEQYIKEKNLKIYSKKPIRIPQPEFYIVYNGREKIKENEYVSKLEYNFGKTNILNAEAKIIDIRYNELSKNKTEEENDKLSKNNVLLGYSYFTKRYEYYKIKEKQEVEVAIDNAIKDCQEKGVLKEYLKNKGWLTMAVEAYTWEQQMKEDGEYLKELGIKQGIEQGIEKTVYRNLKLLLESNIPVEVMNKFIEENKVEKEIYYKAKQEVEKEKSERDNQEEIER